MNTYKQKKLPVHHLFFGGEGDLAPATAVRKEKEKTIFIFSFVLTEGVDEPFLVSYIDGFHSFVS